MPKPRSKLLLLSLAAGASALALGLPAFGQEAPPQAAPAPQDAPESLLPPGFADPVAPAAPTPAAPGEPSPLLPAAPAAGEESVQLDELLAGVPEELTPQEQAAAEAEARELELPSYARRPIAQVGAFGPAQSGFPVQGFGGADGRYLTGLMRRLDAPLASRWASILLRRALLTNVPTPRNVEAADWVAERAWLLLRMGEADGARMLVQAVDVERYSPRLYTVAMQTALATADPAALCPIAQFGGALSDEPAWPMARAICAGLSGDAGTSGALIDEARQRRTVRGIDLQLAEKIVGAGTAARRSVQIDWRGVSQLTAWRFGMASALGVRVPEELYGTAGRHVQAWRARAPMLPAAERVDPARTAAVFGVLSAASLVDLYAQLGEDASPFAVDDTPSGRLRRAYAATAIADRMTALRALWADPADERARYASQLLTARAAGRIAPSGDLADDAAELIAAMLSAGLDRQAMRWWPVVEAEGDAEGWALLALSAPNGRVPVDADQVEGFGERRRAQLLFAGLAGLGRLPRDEAERLAGVLDVRVGRQDAWTRALERAVVRNQPATVALLAAAGLQSVEWSGVPAEHLYHIVRALRATGHEAEARMIAAEAVARSA